MISVKNIHTLEDEQKKKIETPIFKIETFYHADELMLSETGSKRQ